ncbi:hypothetical protein UlMin_021512 [Ulmus minor]
MPIIRSTFCFLLGTACGAYIAQNYNLPNIKSLATSTLFKAKQVEETYRKPGSVTKQDDTSFRG